MVYTVDVVMSGMTVRAGAVHDVVGMGSRVTMSLVDVASGHELQTTVELEAASTPQRAA